MHITDETVGIDRNYRSYLERRVNELESQITAILAQPRNYRFWRAVSAWLAVLLVVIVVGACQAIWWK